jgi:4a-hydroxytetrahydrobiopterin dehydratase
VQASRTAKWMIHFFKTIFLQMVSQRITPRDMANTLSTKEIKEALKDLPQWEAEGKAIERTFEFDDFSEAMDFVNGVAELAEDAGHHPDIEIHFNKVRLILSTHSKGGVTEADLDLAERIDTLVDE